jgi:hypothetical protein
MACSTNVGKVANSLRSHLNLLSACSSSILSPFFLLFNIGWKDRSSHSMLPDGMVELTHLVLDEKMSTPTRLSIVHMLVAIPVVVETVPCPSALFLKFDIPHRVARLVEHSVASRTHCRRLPVSSSQRRAQPIPAYIILYLVIRHGLSSSPLASLATSCSLTSLADRSAPRLPSIRNRSFLFTATTAYHREKQPQ